MQRLTIKLSSQSFFYALLFICLFTSKISSLDCEFVVFNLEDYTCVKEEPIGSGASGQVYLVSKDGQNFIMKSQKNNKKAKSELDFLIRLKETPNIVTIQDYWFDDVTMITILQYGELGSLLKVLQNNDKYFGNVKNCLVFFRKVFNAVFAMHKLNIIHADLKLENIVVTKDYEPLIIDFDLAVNKYEIASYRGTKSYMAPEIIQAANTKNKIIFNEKIDLYALGVIFYAMVKRKMPIKYKPLSFQDMISQKITFEASDPDVLYKITKHLVTLSTKRYDDKKLDECLVKYENKNKFLSLGVQKSYSLSSLLLKDSSSAENSKFLQLIDQNNKSQQYTLLKENLSEENFFKNHVKEILIISIGVLIFGFIIFYIIYKRCKSSGLLEKSIDNELVTN